MDPFFADGNESNFDSLPIDAYLLQALNSSMKDREFILQVERRILQLLRGSNDHLLFEQLNSFWRMLVHRVTRFYRLERIVSPGTNVLTIWKPPRDYKRPLLKLSDLVEPQDVSPPQAECPKVSERPPSQKIRILKRDEEKESPDAKEKANRKVEPPVRSLRERELEYEEAKARIFSSFKEEGDIVNSLSNTLELHGIRETLPPEGDQDDNVPGNEKDVIHFQGWKDIDKIEPFIPTYDRAVRPAVTSEIPSFVDKICIPDHILVVEGVSSERDIKALKSRCKQNHCKLCIADDATCGLLVFSYRVGSSQEELACTFGFNIKRWRPYFLPEPPNQ